MAIYKNENGTMVKYSGGNGGGGLSGTDVVISETEPTNQNVGDLWLVVECKHNYVVTYTTPATCTESGYITYTCTECGDTYTEEIAALGHDYVNDICSRCGETHIETAPMSELGDWKYTLNDESKTITLDRYIGESSDVSVYGAYSANENKYNTILGYMPFYNSSVNSVQIKTGTKCKNGNRLFYGFTGNICDLNGLDTSECTNMSEMFANCTSLTILDLSHFNTDNVTNMNNMFTNCALLKVIDMTGFNTSNVVQMSQAFSNCPSLEHVYVTKGLWSLNNCSDWYSYDTSKLFENDIIARPSYVCHHGDGTYSYEHDWTDEGKPCSHCGEYKGGVFDKFGNQVVSWEEYKQWQGIDDASESLPWNHSASQWFRFEDGFRFDKYNSPIQDNVEKLIIPAYEKALGGNTLTIFDPKQIIFQYGIEELNGNFRGDYTFSNCELIKVPTSITNIKNVDMQYNDSLYDFVIYGENIPYSFSFSAGYLGKNVKSIQFADGLTTINSMYLDNSEYITELNIPATVTKICRAIELPNLETINIPENCQLGESYNGFAFQNCNNLNNVYIPDGATVYAAVFCGCGNLSYIKISPSATFINSGYVNGGFFIQCPKLLTAGNGEQYNVDFQILQNGMFENSLIENVVIPNGTTNIGDSSFYNCINLNEVTIPDSVTSIGRYAFGSCSALSDLVIPDSVISISDKAFYNVPHITYHGTATGAPWGALSMN